jgi:hypothetical protein
MGYGRFNKFVGDPHWIAVRWPAKCDKCGKPISRGEQAFYYPRGKKMYGKACGCGGAAEQDFHNMTEQEAYYGGGSGDLEPEYEGARGDDQ